MTSAGLAFKTIETGQLRGRSPAAAIRSLQKMAIGQRQSLKIMRAYQPDAVLVTGGYVCVPVVVAARRLGRPVLIYLPDVIPGLAVRVLSVLAQQVAVTCAAAATHFKGKALVTGYPVRRALLSASGSQEAARRDLGLEPALKTLLVFGGSRGSRSINKSLVPSLAELLSICQVIHISGHLDWPWVQKVGGTLSQDLGARYHPYPYLDEKMAAALASADLVVSRAGAATLGEYPALGLPSLLVPYPHAGRHQDANARYLADQGAAEVLADELLREDLLPTVRRLLVDDLALTNMARSACALAAPDAAARICHALQALAGRSTRAVSSDGGVM